VVQNLSWYLNRLGVAYSWVWWTDRRTDRTAVNNNDPHLKLSDAYIVSFIYQNDEHHRGAESELSQCYNLYAYVDTHDLTRFLIETIDEHSRDEY